MNRKVIENMLVEHNGLRYVYYDCWQDNIAPTISRRLFYNDIDNGSGNEVKSKKGKPKFASIASSSALAVNTFALWKDETYLKTLEVCGSGGFTELSFESKFKNKIGTPPNLDVVLSGVDKIIGIECKFLEPFGKKHPKFSDKYFNVEDHRKNSKWYEAMKGIRRGNAEFVFEYLDVAQLIKHYFGICCEKNKRDRTLLYLYWEPSEYIRKGYKPYEQHMIELKHFADLVKDDAQLEFKFLSYQDLWQSWEKLEIPGSIRTQIKWVKNKYNI